MERWVDKVAVVTGASSGIGRAIALDLVNVGINVVALARRKDRLDELQAKVSKETSAKLYPIKCDVTVEEEIKNTFEWIEKHLGGVDILVNNAGILRAINLMDENNTTALKEVLNTNVLGVVLCTREAFQSMKRRGVNGHVLIINSILGYKVPYLIDKFGSFNIYPATKYALTAMTEVFRQEFQNMQTKIKITSISPGAVRTEIFSTEQEAVLSHVPILEPEDVSQAALFAISTPPHVQIHELTIKPVGECW